jgi:hypothetical protein
MKLESFIPNESNHIVVVPAAFYGKWVEIDINVIDAKVPSPPSRTTQKQDIFKHFAQGKDFPTIDELRKRTAPSKW